MGKTVTLLCGNPACTAGVNGQPKRGDFAPGAPQVILFNRHGRLCASCWPERGRLYSQFEDALKLRIKDGMDRAEAHADPAWKFIAAHALHETCFELRLYSVDDVWDRMAPEFRVDSTGAMGPVMKSAATLKWAEPTGDRVERRGLVMRSGEDVQMLKGHRTPTSVVWRSLICEAALVH